MLHGLERKGFLRSRKGRAGERTRRFYKITPQGEATLNDAKE